MMAWPCRKHTKGLLCVLLALLVLAVFSPALWCGFINLDDPIYVTNNPEVQHGLSWHTVKWAFTAECAGYWLPLTWLSHALDWQLYGSHPAGHHLTSVLLHTASSILLFLILDQLTGALWRSAWVAAIFALHPLRVESVVWVAERKDVLAAFFWMAALGAYACYAQTDAWQRSRCRILYALTLFLFVCGLMAKPVLVTLPFVFLLLDFWPLKRMKFEPHFSWLMVAEKFPFFMLAAADSVVTYLAQQAFGAMKTGSSLPLSARLANMLLAYMSYLGKSFWPVNLGVFYPHHPVGALENGSAVLLLVTISVVAAKYWRQRPYLAVGWLWFLGVLVPMIGLVQVGGQAMADRFTYLPSVGLWVMISWAAGDLVQSKFLAGKAEALGAGLAIFCCIVLTFRQIHFWHDTSSIYTHSTSLVDQHYVTYHKAGLAAIERREFAKGIDLLQEALNDAWETPPWIDRSHDYNDLGFAYLQEGQIANAVSNLEKALAIQVDYPEAYFNLGNAFLANNQPDVAVDCFKRALARDAGVAEIHYKLAKALAQLGKQDEASAEYSKAERLRNAAAGARK
jgi:protein O-mannosyl-transferase